jgi:hypothetical protein
MLSGLLAAVPTLASAARLPSSLLSSALNLAIRDVSIQQLAMLAHSPEGDLNPASSAKHS